jgi:hypothetical protein
VLLEWRQPTPVDIRVQAVFAAQDLKSHCKILGIRMHFGLESPRRYCLQPEPAFPDLRAQIPGNVN